MKIEKTEIWITTKRPFAIRDGRTIRGFIGNLYNNRPEFHGHRGDKLVYKHPLVQYKVFNGSALIVGLKEGAYLLKAIPRLEFLEIYFQKYSILEQNTSTEVVAFGLTENMIRYSFATPWVGLNEENYEKYIGIKNKLNETRALLDRILTGNLLSMSKSLGYVVENRIQVISQLKECDTVEAKEGTRLTAFEGEFEANFIVPDRWGLGKFSSRGYGTVRCISGG